LNNGYTHKIVQSQTNLESQNEHTLITAEMLLSYDHTYFIVCFKNSVRGGQYGLARSVVFGGPNG